MKSPLISVRQTPAASLSENCVFGEGLIKILLSELRTRGFRGAAVLGVTTCCDEVHLKKVIRGGGGDLRLGGEELEEVYVFQPNWTGENPRKAKFEFQRVGGSRILYR